MVRDDEQPGDELVDVAVVQGHASAGVQVEYTSHDLTGGGRVGGSRCAGLVLIEADQNLKVQVVVAGVPGGVVDQVPESCRSTADNCSKITSCRSYR